MINNFISFAERLQLLTANITPIAILSIIPANIFQYLLFLLIMFFLILLAAIVCSVISSAQKWSKEKALKKAFGISDFSKFKVRKMGRFGSKYYRDSGSNCFEIRLPHWKFANEDGSRQNRKVNKVIWEECSLWLHDRHKVYVLSTTNPCDIIFLVHTLREQGVDIAPCSQELEKQERMDEGKKGIDEAVKDVIESVQGNEKQFIELCRYRLTLRGCALSDAPGNNYGLNFFYQKNAQPVMVKCCLAPRDYIVGIEEMKGVKTGTEELFAESCLFITTGHLSVAAAGFAMTNGIEIISDGRLIEMMEEDRPVPADKMYLRWELTNDDLKSLLSEDLLSQIF